MSSRPRPFFLQKTYTKATSLRGVFFPSSFIYFFSSFLLFQKYMLPCLLPCYRLPASPFYPSLLFRSQSLVLAVFFPFHQAGVDYQLDPTSARATQLTHNPDAAYTPPLPTSTQPEPYNAQGAAPQPPTPRRLAPPRCSLPSCQTQRAYAAVGRNCQVPGD